MNFKLILLIFLIVVTITGCNSTPTPVDAAVVDAKNPKTMGRAIHMQKKEKENSVP